MAVINTPVVVSVCHVMRSLEAVVEIRPESARRSRTLTSDEEPQIFFFLFLLYHSSAGLRNTLHPVSCISRDDRWHYVRSSMQNCRNSR